MELLDKICKLSFFLWLGRHFEKRPYTMLLLIPPFSVITALIIVAIIRAT